jgi:hypothetical protein
MDERKGRLDLQQERAKLAKEQTSRVNLDVRRLEGELLHRDDILESWTRAYALFKAHLRAMPQRIAQTAIAATDLKDIEREARKEIDAALAELSSGTVIRSGLDTKAASRTERSRLGRVQPPTVA